MTTGDINEIFFSFQSEGIYLNEPMLFIRFAGCNLECNYCDTPTARVKTYSSQMTIKQVLVKLRNMLKKYKTKIISLTGGEPLLQEHFLQELLFEIKKLKFKSYLETNGTLPDNLQKVVRYIDIISMDIKPPSACKKIYWKEYSEFITIAQRNKKEIFVKMVLDQNITFPEIRTGVATVRDSNPSIPFIIQPVTPGSYSGRRKVYSVSLEKLIFCWKYISSRLKEVYIIPQMHKYWGLK